ncbi:hypothetical protein ACFOVU_14840 [Nocardiopsis sediminis]|uniref:Orn/DAP/Arg decarboxylase 2 N-terminal domain-containing protein n=1 Tax=Nocardiopsis sediminis TaxID=1778267 RepID=A0ABV8FPG9_9ACTN
MIELPKRVHEHALTLTPDQLPVRVYDLPRLDARGRALRDSLPPSVELYFSLHDPPPGAVSALARHASGFEVVSADGLGAVRRERPAARAALRGPGKTREEITAAVAAGNAALHVDSPEELRLILLAARYAGRGVDVLLRVDPPEGSGGGTAAAPVGMDPAALVECAEILDGSTLVRPLGFSTGTADRPDARTLGRLAKEMLDALRPWSSMFGIARPQYAIVGGAPAPGAGRWSTGFDWRQYGSLLSRLAAPGETLRVTPSGPPEPCCGWFLTRVLDVKHHYGRALAVVAGGEWIGDAAPGDVAVVPLETGWDRPWPRPELAAEPVTVTCRDTGAERVLANDVPVDLLRVGDAVAFPATFTTPAAPGPPPGVHTLTA